MKGNETDSMEGQGGNQRTYQAIGVIFILALIGAMIGIVYVLKDTIIEPTQNPTTEKRVTTMQLRATHNDVPVPVQFELRDSHFIITRGTFATNRAELYSGIDPKQNYTLRAWSDAYYISSASCMGTQPVCEVKLDKVAHPEVYIGQTSLTSAQVTLVKNPYEVIRAPIFCIEHTPNLISPRMNVTAVAIPEHYKNHVDICFKAPDIRDGEQFTFPITFERGDMGEEELTILLMDRGVNTQLIEQYETGNMPDMYATTIIRLCPITPDSKKRC